MADVQEERWNGGEERERHETNVEKKSENRAETLAPMKLGDDAINPNPKELLVPLETPLRQKIKAQMPSYSEEDEEEEDFEDEEEEEDEIATNVGNQMKTQHPKSQIEEAAAVEMTQETIERKKTKPEEEEEDEEEEQGSKGKRNTQKRKPLSAFGANGESTGAKKPKKRYNNVWTKSTRRWCRRNKSNGNQSEETVAIAPVHRFPDDSREMKICLSKVYKAEKVELSEDRLSAGSCKGYRMVRATRGVAEGAWFFEIRVSQLGPTGHTRLGWTTEKGDLQAPVGYDGNGYGYRDIDGTKIHKAVREKYGEEGYVEGDVIGCYVNLPEGSLYAPKPPRFVWHKGQKYVCVPEKSEDPPKVIPGSEISFFRNGICQGVAFTDLYGGRYYPAASMYTLPNQPNCVVRFNFGPDFDCFPQDLGGRPVPLPMIDAPYHGFDVEAVENSEDHPPENENGQSDKKT